MFYGISPSLSEKTGQHDEIVRVAEDGFRSPSEYSNFGFEESIKLHSTIDGADTERINHHLENRRMGKGKGWGEGEDEDSESESEDEMSSSFSMDDIDGVSDTNANNHCHGQMLLVKTFVGNRTEIDKRDVEKIRKISPKGYDCTESVFVGESDTNNEENSSKQKTWHIFNAALALPEYLIDYEYLSEDNVGYDKAKREAELGVLKRELVGGGGGATEPTEQECVDMVSERSGGGVVEGRKTRVLA